MNKRVLAAGVAALTVVITLLAQLEMRDDQERYIQHIRRAADVNLEKDGTACIHPTALSQKEYDPKAVDVNALSTHLPLITIDTRGKRLPGVPYAGSDGLVKYTTAENGETTILADMNVYEKEGVLHKLSDKPDVKTDIRIRIRGNTSRWFDKSSYAVRTVNKAGENKDLPLLGMEKHHEWALHGPYLDKSLMRNYLGMNISGQLMDFAPDARFCEVIVNGDYMGLYVLMETVSKGKGRIDISGPNEKRNVTGFILQLDSRETKQPETLETFSKYATILPGTAHFLLEYPGEKLINPELRRYVQRSVSMAEKALYSFDYDSKTYGYFATMDLDEFVDYFLMIETFEIYDTGAYSTYFYRDINGKFKPCVWDFNNGCDNYSNIQVVDWTFACAEVFWYKMISKDEIFTSAALTRYHNLRQEILSDEYLENFIDDTIEYLGPAIDRNFAVWGFSFNEKNLDRRNKLPDGRNPTSYEAAVNQLKTALFRRLHWLDKNLVVIKQYSHESAVKKFNH